MDIDIAGKIRRVDEIALKLSLVVEEAHRIAGQPEKAAQSLLDAFEAVRVELEAISGPKPKPVVKPDPIPAKKPKEKASLLEKAQGASDSE